MHIYYCFSFEEISETCVPKGSAIQLVLTSGVRFILYSHRANQIHAMIEKYCLDNEKVGNELHCFEWLHSGDGIFYGRQFRTGKTEYSCPAQISV
jgi:hypothetical protein